MNLFKTARINRKAGIIGRLDVILGVTGAGAGAAAGCGFCSGIGAAIGGVGGFLAGSLFSFGHKRKLASLHKNI